MMIRQRGPFRLLYRVSGILDGALAMPFARVRLNLPRFRAIWLFRIGLAGQSLGTQLSRGLKPVIPIRPKDGAGFLQDIFSSELV